MVDLVVRERRDQRACALDDDPLREVLPCWDWRARHTAVLPRTTAAATFAAVRAVTRAEVTPASVLRGDDPTVTLLDQLARRGFFPLGEPAGAGATDLVLGRIAHLWRPGDRRTSAAEFAAFDEPGHARAALLVAAHDVGDDALLVAEARVLATDERSLAGLSRQWLLVAWSRRLPLAELLTATRQRLGVGRHSDRALIG